MSLQGLTDEQIQAMEAHLLEIVRARDGSFGNISLLRELGWPEHQYWSVRDRLVNAGELQLGRGRGGSVRLAGPQAPTAAPVRAQVQEVAEADLYEPMAGVIRDHWAKDQRFGEYLVEITARQGRRDTGGTWSRPDIVVASLTTLLYIPGKHFDIVTFEVKPWFGLDVTSVYEALAHARAATRSYVLVHAPEDRENEDYGQRALERVADEAKRRGIGLITAAAPHDYETWEERVDAVYSEPSPHALNDFISLQFSDGAKQELTRWFR